MSRGLFLADLVTIIGTQDLVFEKLIGNLVLVVVDFLTIFKFKLNLY